MRLRWVAIPVALLVAGVAGGFADATLVGLEYQVVTTSTRSMAFDGTTRLVLRNDLTPARGDIVLFDTPTTWHDPDAQLVKRVVGVGGDTVACCDTAGRLTVNGRSITENYLRADPPGPQQTFPAVTVPAGDVFVAGDNRNNSFDSRFAGPVPLSDVTGVAVATMPARLDVRPLPPTTAFAGLPGASPGTDSWYGFWVWLVVVAAAVALVAFLWLVGLGATALIRPGRRRRAALSQRAG